MTDDPQHREVKRIDEPWRPTARQILFGVVALVMVVFAALNAEETEVDFLFANDVRMPLIVVMVIFGALGFGAGLLFERRRAGR